MSRIRSPCSARGGGEDCEKAVSCTWRVRGRGNGVHGARHPPEHFDYDFEDEFVDTEVCASEPWGFDVFATQHEHGEVTIFFDDEGNFVRAVNHLDLRFTISVNGITLNERDRFNIFSMRMATGRLACGRTSRARPRELFS